MHTYIPDAGKDSRQTRGSKPILLLGKSAISAIRKPGEN